MKSPRLLPVLVAMATGLSAATNTSLRVGQAAVDLTPPPLMPFHAPQRPPFPATPAEGVHDPLHAKAIVFESGGIKAAIVACDMTSLRCTSSPPPASTSEEFPRCRRPT
jgi:hypothetical protein